MPDRPHSLPWIPAVSLATAALLWACAPSGPTSPELFVTKTEDTFDGACQPGDCSLREAVAAANQTPGPNTIHLPSGTYRLTRSGLGEDSAASGDLDLAGDLTLIGEGWEGAQATFITAAPDFGDRLVHVLSGSVRLENLYLGGGVADAGAVLYVAPRAEAQLHQVRLDAGSATGQDGGGLIFNEGTLTVESARLTNGCSAGPGGAMVNRGTTAVRDSTIESNESLGPGGAIANQGTLRLEGSVISQSHAGRGKLCQPAGRASGGGVFNEGTLTVTDSQILRTAASLDGGAIFSSGTLTVEGAVLRSVASGSGGGIAVGAGRARLADLDLEANTESGDGGGVWVGAGASAEIVDSLIAGNAGRNGGGVSNRGQLTVRTSTITFSRAMDGGGVQSTGELSLQASSVRQNSARQHGGGVFVTGMTTINDSTIAGNTADYGGGMWLQGSATVQNCTVSANNAASEGGGVVLWATGDFKLIHCTLTRNASVQTSGLLADSYATVSNTIIGGNSLGANCDVRRQLLAVGNLDSDGSCGFSETGNWTGDDPRLGPLEDNGGPTQTHRLLPDSPARNRADPTVCLPADQRGITRPQDGRCDIGSVEMQPGG